MPPDSTVIDEEGVLFDNFLLVERGQLREQALLALLRSGPHPVRNETQNVADLQAQVAACQRGANELAKMVGQFGLDTVRAYMGHVQDNAEEAVRRAVAALSGEADLPLIGGLLRDLGGSVTVTVESRARAGVTPG